MPGGSRSSNTDTEHKSPRESGEDSEDESEILEESPCGRWLKRKEEVEQRDVPGIDGSHLAMDTEEGVEVVWNEVQFSERKNFKSQEEKIQQVFDNLTQLEHPNIVKFHRYWTDTHNDKPRVIFITEYMSSGSLKQFLKRTKRNVKKLPLEAWKRWCKQILSALSYLHSCSPPIIHGNLTCDTIFIQHNGLVKIGSVAPDAIHHHVKTCRENMKNMHFIAPEYGSSLTHAIDIYSFGMCALEMAALEIQGNGDSGTLVTDEHISRTIDSLDDSQQKDFIYKCLNKDPLKRPSAKDLLFHPLVFEVHTLKLLAAHCLVNTAPNFSETIIDEMMLRLYKPDVVLADIQRAEERKEYKLADVPAAEKLEKFVEDVKYGIYPLTAYTARLPPPPRPRAISPETAESPKPITPEPLDVETRKVVNMMCSVKPREDSCDLLMTILLRMDDKMNRQLTCQVSPDDSASHLSDELVHLGFIHETDREKLTALIEDTLYSSFNKQHQLMGSTLMPSTDIHHHLHHQLPVPYNSASVERSWTVADIDSPGTTSVDGSSTPAEYLCNNTATTSSTTLINEATAKTSSSNTSTTSTTATTATPPSITTTIINNNFDEINSDYPQHQQHHQHNNNVELVQAAVEKLITTMSKQYFTDTTDDFDEENYVGGIKTVATPPPSSSSPTGTAESSSIINTFVETNDTNNHDDNNELSNNHSGLL